jgi:hypothetical protein
MVTVMGVFGILIASLIMRGWYLLILDMTSVLTKSLPCLVAVVWLPLITGSPVWSLLILVEM